MKLSRPTDPFLNVQWESLRRLRHVFVHAPHLAAEASYWTPSLLRDYDLTLGERIRWKWTSVLDELHARGWTPPGDTLLDWGCGTGVATRAVLARWPGHFRLARLHDRSGPAHEHATQSVAAVEPGLKIAGQGPAPLLVVSHVLNELPPEAVTELVERARQATAVIWIEPGTREHSRRLLDLRAQLVPGFHAVAPCTHDGPCGLLLPENERHWCHHFARPPKHVFHDAGWSRFAKELKVDIGTVPYSYLVLDKRDPPARDGLSRRIGHARIYKGMLKVLDCAPGGVRDVQMLQRVDKEFFQALKKGKAPALVQWHRDAQGRIQSVTPVYPTPNEDPEPPVRRN